MRFGNWWAIQRTCSGRSLSLGFHLETEIRISNAGVKFGPYVDFHVLQWCFSLGRNPIYAGELHLKASYSRGGLSADSN